MQNKSNYNSGMMGQLVKMRVMKKLEEMFPGYYTEQNVVLSATHTHSGPAGKGTKMSHVQNIVVLSSK